MEMIKKLIVGTLVCLSMSVWADTVIYDAGGGAGIPFTNKHSCYHDTALVHDWSGTQYGPDPNIVVPAKTFRIYGTNGLEWLTAEPSIGVYNWTYWDQALAKLVSAGVQDIYFNLWNPPDFTGSPASHSWNMSNVDTVHVNRWLSAVKAKVESYGLTLKYVEVANEVVSQQIGAFWKPAGDGAGLASLATKVLDWRDANSPSTLVIAPSIPGFEGNRVAFFAWLDANPSLKTRFDGYAAHYYFLQPLQWGTPTGAANGYTISKEFRDELVARGLGSKLIFDYEHGFSPNGFKQGTVHNTAIAAALYNNQATCFFQLSSPANTPDSWLGGQYINQWARDEFAKIFSYVGKNITKVTEVTGQALWVVQTGGAANADCTSPWATTVLHGNSITAYRDALVPDGQSCVSESRTCTNGALSGTFTNQSCSVAPASGTTPALCGAGTSATGTTASTVVNKPACVTDGMLELMSVGVQGVDSGLIITPPSGWTQVLQTQSATANKQYWVFRKIAAGEPASYTVSFNYAPDNTVIGVLGVSGVHGSTPVNVSGAAVQTTSNSPQSPDVTTTSANTLLVYTGWVDHSSNFTPPSGMTEQLDVAGGLSFEMATVAQASAGATGTKTATTTGTAGHAAGAIVAVAPNAAGGDCTAPWGANVAQGASVTAYQADVVPYLQTCLSQVRTCTGGVLSGTYTKQSCTVLPPATCQTPWGGTIADGTEVLAFQANSVPNQTACVSELRRCDNGGLSGTFTFQTCVVEPPAPVDATLASMATQITTLQNSVNALTAIVNNQTTLLNSISADVVSIQEAVTHTTAGSGSGACYPKQMVKGTVYVIVRSAAEEAAYAAQGYKPVAQ